MTDKKHMTMDDFNKLFKEYLGQVTIKYGCNICYDKGIILDYEKLAIVKCPKCNQIEKEVMK